MKLRADGLEEYLKFKSNGEYEYFECENCDGPMLGHQVAKCRHNEGYEETTIVGFKKWLDKIPELRRLLEARATYMADRAAKKQAEMMDRVIRDATEARGTRQLEDQDEPFAQSFTKGTSTNYVTNDNRSRIDDWRSRLQSRGDRRSESRPGYSRTA